MKDARADVLVILGDKTACLLIENNQTGSIRPADDFVRVVHSIVRIDVEKVAIQ